MRLCEWGCPVKYATVSAVSEAAGQRPKCNYLMYCLAHDSVFFSGFFFLVNTIPYDNFEVISYF